MRRYSFLWWSVMLPTSLVVGLPTYLLLDGYAGLSFVASLAIAILASLAADLAIAVAMETVAPTRLNIGPGERQHKSDVPAETATVISGFSKSSRGRVRIRGEAWRARRLPGETREIAGGVPVRVVARDGLELVVSAAGDPGSDGQTGRHRRE